MRLAVIALCALLLGCNDSDVSRRVGARCDTAGDCDERCLTSGIQYPGGFCTVTCSASDDCPDHAACAVIGSATDPDAVCLFTCDGDGDCAFLGEDWHCAELDRAGGGNKVAVCRG
ncbi:MAG TPA: hypothetical protein VGC42_23825 [Kofleriaceae bacterium]